MNHSCDALISLLSAPFEGETSCRLAGHLLKSDFWCRCKWRDLDRIDANNDAIAHSDAGEFGRLIRVEMLSAEVPLHYLINFVAADFTAAVEQGIADARAWCGERNIALTYDRADKGFELLALKFNETMRGGFALGETDPEAGRRQGLAKQAELTMHASIQIDDLDRFLNQADHPGSLSGTIDFPPFGAAIVATNGVFNLFRPDAQDDLKLFVHELGFEIEGKQYYLAGRKEVHPGAEVLKDTTTLYTRLHEGADATGPVIGRGF